jgi:hypothetical protein
MLYRSFVGCGEGLARTILPTLTVGEVRVRSMGMEL